MARAFRRPLYDNAGNCSAKGKFHKNKSGESIAPSPP